MDEFPSVRVEGCCDNVHRNSVVIDVIVRTRSAGVSSAL